VGRIYQIKHGGTLAATDIDVWTVQAPTDAAVRLLGVDVGQVNQEGIDNSEQRRIGIYRMSAIAIGGGGSTKTPVPIDKGDAAFGGTVKAFHSSLGTLDETLFEGAFNNQVGFHWEAQGAMAYVISPQSASPGLICVRIYGATLSNNHAGMLTFEEIGG